jgi:glycosyltransferase involved in cell wall biosynthesis
VSLELSILVPARDEEPNLEALVGEVEALRRTGLAAELIIVDDGSTDGTPALLSRLARSRPWLRPFRLPEGRGQSAALAAAIQEAKGSLLATLDADLQNDPADLLTLLPPLRRGEADLVQGVRVDRRDSAFRKLSSFVGYAARRAILGDLTRDTGCSTRVFTPELGRRLPLALRGMHRFVPVLSRGMGARIIEVPVSHRPRRAGRSKYGALSRAAAGLVDCLAVRWMLKRHRDPLRPAARAIE